MSEAQDQGSIPWGRAKEKELHKMTESQISNTDGIGQLMQFFYFAGLKPAFFASSSLSKIMAFLSFVFL